MEVVADLYSQVILWQGMAQKQKLELDEEMAIWGQEKAKMAEQLTVKHTELLVSYSVQRSTVLIHAFVIMSRIVSVS